MLTFRGTVGSRSSSGVGGPPGEADVLTLNPQRRDAILRATSWTDLVPGTLNLEVAEEAVHRLLLCNPVIREDGDSVKYPAQYTHIPKLRVGYLYYAARLKAGTKVTFVLIRRAVNPLKTRLEAFSDQRLREALALSDGDQVACEVDNYVV